MNSIRPTRYPELGYRNDGHKLWRIYVVEDEATIGPHYATKAELLADLYRFAKEYGLDV
jgi:hypothetical protein